MPLKPRFDLPDYKGLSITSELEPVMDEQIDSTVAELRKGQSTPEAAGDEGLDEEGFVMADIAFEHEEKEGLRARGHAPEHGERAPRGRRRGLRRGHEGHQVEGEERTFPMELPDFLEEEDARGKDGVCRSRPCRS